MTKQAVAVWVLMVVQSTAISEPIHPFIPVGADCKVEWAANPITEQVDKYAIAFAKESPVTPSSTGYLNLEVTQTDALCSEAGVDLSAPGVWFLSLYAHNVVGWSAASEEKSFSVSEPPTTPPTAPETTSIILVTIQVQ